MPRFKRRRFSKRTRKYRKRFKRKFKRKYRKGHNRRISKLGLIKRSVEVKRQRYQTTDANIGGNDPANIGIHVLTTSASGHTGLAPVGPGHVQRIGNSVTYTSIRGTYWLENLTPGSFYRVMVVQYPKWPAKHDIPDPTQIVPNTPAMGNPNRLDPSFIDFSYFLDNFSQPCNQPATAWSLEMGSNLECSVMCPGFLRKSSRKFKIIHNKLIGTRQPAVGRVSTLGAKYLQGMGTYKRKFSFAKGMRSVWDNPHDDYPCQNMIVLYVWGIKRAGDDGPNEQMIQVATDGDMAPHPVLAVEPVAPDSQVRFSMVFHKSYMDL